LHFSAGELTRYSLQTSGRSVWIEQCSSSRNGQAIPCWKYCRPSARLSWASLVSTSRSSSPEGASEASASSNFSRTSACRGSGSSSTSAASACASAADTGTSCRQHAPQPARQETRRPSASAVDDARCANRSLRPLNIGISCAVVTGPAGTVNSKRIAWPRTTNTSLPVTRTSSSWCPTDSRTTASSAVSLREVGTTSGSATSGHSQFLGFGGAAGAEVGLAAGVADVGRGDFDWAGTSPCWPDCRITTAPPFFVLVSRGMPVAVKPHEILPESGLAAWLGETTITPKSKAIALTTMTSEVFMTILQMNCTVPTQTFAG
jgi:hypothetical protein